MSKLSRFLISCAGALVTFAATAQPFPTRPITLLCAFPPGGGADVALRVLADGASKHLGQRIIIDNRPGVGGTLAAASLMTARPDGYTLAQVTNTLVRQPFIAKTLYDPAKDFTYVLGVTAFEFGIVVRAEAPWKTLDEFLNYAKANLGRVTYGTSGVGTAGHVVMERLGQIRGIEWVHAPYKGSAPLMKDLKGGHLHAVSDVSSWGPFVDSGDFRLLAVYNATRQKRWPNAPTLKELGFDIVESVPWGIVGPAGIDPKIVARLEEAFRKAMEQPSFLETLSSLGQEPRFMSSEQYRKYMMDRTPIEHALVDKYNLRIQ